MSVKLYELFGNPEDYNDKLSRFHEDLESFVRETGEDGAANDRNEGFLTRLNNYETKLLLALHFEPRVPPMLVKPHIDSI